MNDIIYDKITELVKKIINVLDAFEFSSSIMDHSFPIPIKVSRFEKWWCIYVGIGNI